MEVSDPKLSYIGQFCAKHSLSEPAFRLLLTVLLGYPLALIHRYFLFKKNPNYQHFYFAACGLYLCCFNYGFKTCHSVINIGVVYGVLLVAGGTLFSAVFTFVFCMGYLLAGYFFTATGDYDITWTMPHCILCLRLIGLAFDVYDGQKDPTKLPHDQKRTALDKVPTILEVMGHSYFFGAFLVGPQFPMKRYKDFVQGSFFKKDSKPSCIKPALLRLALGLLVLAFNLFGSKYYDDKYMLSDQFLQYNFLMRFLHMGVWQIITLHKYVSCWLLAEGSCIMAGLTYNGEDENGNDLWNGCVNIDVALFETATTFGNLIKSFNINTNLWVAQYIFKRLKFLGNKDVSQLSALLFLAVWHGLHSGYYVCFFNEFIVMKFERDVIEIIERLPRVKHIVYHKYLHIPRLIILKVFVMGMFGYCIVPFVLLSFDRYSEAYSRVYWCGHIIYLSWIPLSPYVLKAIPRPATSKKAD
uniref:Lysophospholipid acyltransferase 5 n=1 Tax=Ornithodoros turicata TaxID=34597 RepID=A0A2R5LM33_9ACAR